MKSIDDIKGLINRECLEKSIENNKDGYGAACVNVAINIMKHLDDFEGEFNIGYHPDMTTPHGITCACDDQGGITGFMAGAARNIVTFSHVLGWKFFVADVISPYSIDDNEKIKQVIKNITSTDYPLVDVETVTTYIDELIARYKRNKS